MHGIIDLMLDVDWWKVIVPVFLAIGAWAYNEWSKRQWEEYKRKEVSYAKLLRTLQGFYADSGDKSMREAFLSEVRVCWLYASDEVINYLNLFLSKVEEGADDTEAAVGKLVLAIRRDLLSRRLIKRTKLRAEDFRILSAT